MYECVTLLPVYTYVILLHCYCYHTVGSSMHLCLTHGLILYFIAFSYYSECVHYNTGSSMPLYSFSFMHLHLCIY